MNFNDVLTLAKAGFNAQQISALSASMNQVSNVANQPGAYLDTDSVAYKLPVMNSAYGVMGNNIGQSANSVEQQLNMLNQQIAALAQYVLGANGGKTLQVQQSQPTVQGNTAMDDKLNVLSQQVNGLTQQLQLGNIAGTNQPPQETTDDILASIILPPATNSGVNSGGGK